MATRRTTPLATDRLAVPTGRALEDATAIWERPEPEARRTPGPLSRARIVAAALALADRDGLAAVSLRKVGAELDAGPMRLYGYLETKEELLARMVDAIYGEVLAHSALSLPKKAEQKRREPWRMALGRLARSLRSVALLHPWFIDLVGGRPHLGPFALAYLEQEFSALSNVPGFENIDAAKQALHVFNSYVLGAIRNEASELRAAQETTMNETEWQIHTEPYILRKIATGAFPNIARVVQESSEEAPEVTFNRGLECIFAGIALRFVPRFGASPSEDEAGTNR